MGIRRDIILNTKRERIIVESTILGGIVCPCILMNKMDVYIYGAGKNISSAITFFEGLGIDITAVFDIDKSKSGEKILGRVPVVNPYELPDNSCSSNSIVLINTYAFFGIDQFTIITEMQRIGIKYFYDMQPEEKDTIKMKPYFPTDFNRVDYYYSHIDELENTYEMLYDDISKSYMAEFIRTFISHGSFSIPQCDGQYKYFSTDKNNTIYTHLEDEVWINCGSNIGDTLFWYYANGYCAKKVYAFEGDKSVFGVLERNVRFLPNDCLKNIELVNEYIDETTEWEKAIKEKVTLINADIEGAELDMLKSMKEVITQCRPVMAICVYHKAEDLVEIPLFLKSILKGYSYILRKYEANISVDPKRIAELVMYAVPDERLDIS